jgi:hypothetical protein
MLIRGKELLDPPYRQTKRAILNHCATGKLTPFLSARGQDRFLDRKAPGGWQRAFRNDELREKHRRLCFLYYELDTAQKWLSKSDDTHIKEHEQHLASLSRFDQRLKAETPSIDKFKADFLSHLREDYSETAGKLPPEIEKLESELTPARAWQNIDTLEAAWSVLADAFFHEAQVEALPVTAGLEARSTVTEAPPRPTSGKTDPLSTREGKALLKAAGNEALRLFLSIQGHLTLASDALQRKTKAIFSECHPPLPWKYILPEYLDDPSLYQLNTSSKERRDFVGRLLQKILKDNNIVKRNCQTLYDKYLEVK